MNEDYCTEICMHHKSAEAKVAGVILAFSRIWEGENVLKVPVSVWLEVMGARVIMSVALTSASIRSARGTSRFGLCVPF